MLESLSKKLGYKVLAFYLCGSSAYNLALDSSDIDYTVIVEEEIINVIKENKVDYFILGKDNYKKVLNQDDGVFDYFKVWADNASIAFNKLISIDDSYVDEFKSVINIDWDKNIHKWLELNIGYYSSRLVSGTEEKTLYNVYKLNSIVEHFRKTGQFLSFFSKEDYDLAFDFKTNPSNRPAHREKLISIINKLTKYLKEDFS